MEKTVTSNEAPRRFGDLLHDVSDQGDHVVVEEDGIPVAALVPFALYATWKRRRAQFFQQMRNASERANMSESEAIQLTDEAKHAIRSHH
jgi:prevent-host-death family protein